MAKIGYGERASRDMPEGLIGSEGWIYGLLENVDALAFDRLGELKKQSRAIPDWPKGRLFNESAELRWRQGRYGLHIVYVTDGDTLPEGVCDGGTLTRAVDENGKEIEDREVVLWGKREGDVWLEGRIPRPLHYPVAGAEKSRAKIVVRTYRLQESKDNESELYRFVDVDVVAEKGGA